MRKGLITMLCMLALCLGFAAPAFASDANDVTIKETNIKADTVVNYGGYGSISTDAVYEDPIAQYPLVKKPSAALIDRSGGFLFPFKDTFNRYAVFDGVVSLVNDNGAYYESYSKEWGLGDDGIDRVHFYTLDGKEIAKGDYFGASPMKDGYAFVTEFSGSADGTMKVYIIDASGRVVKNFDGPYVEMSSFGEGPYGCGISAIATAGWCSEGLLNCVSHGSGEDYGNTTYVYYVDMAGNTVFSLPANEYMDDYPFQEGLAAVQSKATGKFGYVDKTGKLVIPCEFDSHQYFVDGLAGACKDGKWGYIDKQGNTVIPFEYDAVYGAGDGLAAVVKNGKCGLVDYDNNVIVPLEYEDISSYEGGVAYALKDGNVVIISDYRSTPRLKVSFDMNGLGSAPNPIAVSEGSTVSAPQTPTAIGYTFAGWYTNPQCTNAYDFATPVTQDLTLYAKWNRNEPANGGVEIYRLYNQWSGEHLFTNDPTEANTQAANGWTYETVAWTAPKSSDKPIYRLYNQWSGEHLYTTNKAEYDNLVANGWTGENIKFYSADDDGVPTYRLFNQWEKGPSAHHYTTSATERADLVNKGWRDENICWYGLK